MTLTRLVAAMALSMAMIGCGRPAAPPLAKPVEIDASEYVRVFRAAMEELHAEGFSLDREEYRFGLVTTRPLSSPTMLEPWKSLNATFYQALQATTTDQRRIVAVRIQPINTHANAPVNAPASRPAGTSVNTTSPATSFQLSVEVTIEQAELTDRRLSGSTNGPSIINTFSAAPAELRNRGIPGRYWQAIGRDPYLEHRILAAVVRRSIEEPEDGLPLEGAEGPEGTTATQSTPQTAPEKTAAPAAPETPETTGGK